MLPALGEAMPALSHHKHEYVKKEVEQVVKMILAYSGVNFSYTGFQPTLAQFHIIKGLRLECYIKLRVIRINVKTLFSCRNVFIFTNA